MSRVDFYILPDVDSDAQRRFACRLAYKAWSQGQRVIVRVDDPATAEDLDAMMWEYPAEAFLPHARAGDETSEIAPVLIDCDDRAAPPGAELDGLLINLTAGIPANASRFARIAEVIVAPDRARGRERYRFYRHEGHPLFHHELEDWEA